jgi:cytochrome P450
MRKEVEKVVREVNAGVKPQRKTIFHTVLDPNAAKAYKVPTVQHMVDEAFGMLGAAAETAGNAMTMCAFHIVFNPEIYAKLRKELVEAFPDPTKPPDYLTLEKLPYLTGVVKEGLRLSYGVIHPLPRVVPEGGAVFNGHVLPQGVRDSDPRPGAWMNNKEADALIDSGLHV